MAGMLAPPLQAAGQQPGSVARVGDAEFGGIHDVHVYTRVTVMTGCE